MSTDTSLSGRTSVTLAPPGRLCRQQRTPASMCASSIRPRIICIACGRRMTLVSATHQCLFLTTANIVSENSKILPWFNIHVFIPESVSCIVMFVVDCFVMYQLILIHFLALLLCSRLCSEACLLKRGCQLLGLCFHLMVHSYDYNMLPILCLVTLLHVEQCSQFERFRLQHVQMINKTSSFKTQLTGNNALVSRVNRNTL